MSEPLITPPETERRQCSVLFVDLVGFTPLSEGRDPEEVRELLTRYFDVARTVVGNYGGVIEKFIGDAVMAVWGTPIAVEGDAERAVRAAMELVAKVAELGVDVGTPGLAARAGVVTGTVAATIGAEGQAMVAGDVVNTAARVQSAAPAGAVLVDVTTKRLADLAIDFEPHGEVALKGKLEPESLWRALLVVSGVGGSQRTDGLEAPFVGRRVEFGLLQDLLHATRRERRPRLVLVSGPAGVGKSRLGWELEKYVDGLADDVYWHRGSCPTFGEDTAYWALTEIVRARLGVGDDDDRAVIESKLTTFLAELFDAEADRSFVAARLAPLLGLSAAGRELGRAELFAGWRLFFEGLARRRPVMFLVEDLHDADQGLLDFLEHLVDWVRDLPVLVVCFARPELVEERPGLGTGRNRTLISLAPLGDGAMRELLAGLVTQIPPDAAEAIEAQAQGIPLYAVETIRSLIDQQVVVTTANGYEVVGDIGPLSVPASLHALLAARLDALDPVVRSLAGDAAVIAGPFTAETLVAVSGLDQAHVQAGLAELTQRDVLQVSADTLSPQIGAYSFTHALLAQVVQQTLSHRDLKDRHLRVAAHLAASTRNDGDALAEVVARHYLEALAARPQDDDVASLRETAVDWLVRAAERARSTGAPATASRLFASAAELLGESDGPDEATDLKAADLWVQSAQSALLSAESERALAAADCALELRQTHGAERLVAVTHVMRSRALRRLGRGGPEVLELLLEALDVVEKNPGIDTAEVAIAIADLYSLGDLEGADEATVRAIALTEQFGGGPRLLARAFFARGLWLTVVGRRFEGIGSLNQALDFADEAGDTSIAATALGNLADTLMFSSPRDALSYCFRTIATSRELGSRLALAVGTANACLCLLRLGDWDRAAAMVDDALDIDGLGDIPEATLGFALVWSLRGDPARARDVWIPLARTSDDDQSIAYDEFVLATITAAEGDAADGLVHAREALRHLPTPNDPFVLVWPHAARLAHELGDTDTAAELLVLLDRFKVGEIPPLVRAERLLAEGRLVANAVDRVAAIEEAVAGLRAEGSPYHLALALLDLAEAQFEAGKDPVDIITEAKSIGIELGSPAVVGRAEQLS